MKIFILEDDPIRIARLKQMFLGHELTIVDSCAYEVAFTPPYALILLDHDLGGRQLEDHEDCGATFAELIRDRVTPEDIVIIHSYNPVGAAKMAATLRGVAGEVVLAPFGGAPFMSAIYVALKIRAEEARVEKKVDIPGGLGLKSPSRYNNDTEGD